MAQARQPIRILVVRAWTDPLGPLRDALRDAGFEPRLYVVDIEPALNAALERSDFDAVLHDEAMPGISSEVLAARLREHRRTMPVIRLTTLEEVIEHVRAVRSARLN